jgi:predicted nucleic acid-binding protein
MSDAGAPSNAGARPTTYWDSSALIEACTFADLRRRLSVERGLTRRHALAETFSTLTGKAHLKVSANTAAALLESLTQHLEFVELSTDDYLQAAKAAESAGIRGGAIHDWLHARAAIKAEARKFLTLDANDFSRLLPATIPVEVPAD